MAYDFGDLAEPAAPAKKGYDFGDLSEPVEQSAGKKLTPLEMIIAGKVDPSVSRLHSFEAGVRDPVSGGAQFFQRLLPQSVQEKINALDTSLARSGIPFVGVEGGLEQDIKRREAQLAAEKAASGREGVDWARLGGNVVSPANLAIASRVPGAMTTLGRVAAGVGQGALMGGMSPVTGGDDFLSEKAKQVALGAVTGGMLPSIAGAFERKAARLGAERAANPVRDVTLSEALKAGYTVPPSQAKAGLVSRVLEGVSGKYKTNQLAGLRNQEVTDRLVRESLGLPEGTPLTKETIQAVRREAYRAGYEPVKQAGSIATDSEYGKALDSIVGRFKGPSESFPGAGGKDVEELVAGYKVGKFDSKHAVDAIQDLRDKASQAFRQGDTRMANAYRDLASALEGQVERGLEKSGKSGQETLRGFREARKLMAKSHSVEDALSEGSGSVSATSLAAALKRGAPLSGELKTIAKFGQVFPDVAKIPKSGDANPFTALDVAGEAFGLGAHNPYVAALPLARIGARYAITSPWYQRTIVSPEARQQSANALAQLIARKSPALTALGASVPLSLLPSAEGVGP